MTDPSVPIVPGGIPPAPVTPEAPKPKRSAWPIVLGVVALVIIAGLGATVFALVAKDASTPAAGTTTRGPDPVAPAVEPAEIWPEPLAANIKLTVKVLEKECFGSAGCLITYRVEPEYTGSKLEPGKDWDVTYEVSGAKEPIVNTLVLTGNADGYGYTTERQETTQTPKSSSVLTAKVTSVSPH